MIGTLLRYVDLRSTYLRIGVIVTVLGATWSSDLNGETTTSTLSHNTSAAGPTQTTCPTTTPTNIAPVAALILISCSPPTVRHVKDTGVEFNAVTGPVRRNKF